MSIEDVISHLKELNRDYEEYSGLNELDFKYDILQDGKEMNIIKLYFSDKKLSKICVNFFKYNMLSPMQNTKRFQKSLDELDKTYKNDINWKGKWKSKDGSILVTTDTMVLLDNMYDVLIIQRNSKK